MPKRDDSIFELLAELPWWVSIGAGVAVFVGLRFIVPLVAPEHGPWPGITALTRAVSWAAVVFLIPAGVSALQSIRKRRLLDSQSSIESIRALSWKEFEELLAEAYRRQGFGVQENSAPGPDGGIDLVVQRQGSTYLIQCKQWRASKVGVRVVREMFGVMHDRDASGVIIVTSGMFTQEAQNFAAGKPIDLVDGGQLVDLVRNVRARSSDATPSAASTGTSSSTSICPDCGSELVVRTAKRGKSAGSRFWGCSSFPRCRYKKPIADP